MKYLKYFETETEYASYKNGSDFITPNVSYIEDVDRVEFKGVAIKQFIIKVFGLDAPFDFEEGMTWSEWVDTKYNNVGSSKIYLQNNEVYFQYSVFTRQIPVNPEDKIEEKIYQC